MPAGPRLSISRPHARRVKRAPRSASRDGYLPFSLLWCGKNRRLINSIAAHGPGSQPPMRMRVFYSSPRAGVKQLGHECLDPDTSLETDSGVAGEHGYLQHLRQSSY